MYDVVIVGAGPAGATLARRVGRRLRTLVVEARGHAPAGGAGRAKVCGGLLAPDAQRALAALGLGVPGEVLAGPQLFAVRAVDLETGQERHYPRAYLNVDRGRFDGWLRSLLPPEVEVRAGTRVTAIRDGGDAAEVALWGPAGREVVRAALVVGADGAGSAVRRLAFPAAPAPTSYVAIQEWFEARHAEPCFTAAFDPGVTDFYGWAIPKGDRLAVGAALPPGPGLPERFARLVRGLERAGLRLGRSLGREGTRVLRPLRAGDVWLGAGRVALAGEAAGLVSPSSAEGVSFALRSAAALAAALEQGVDGWTPRYAAGTAGLRAGLRAKAWKARVVFTPALRRALLASGVGAIPVGEPAGRLAAPLLCAIPRER